jgi:pyruvyl transferase EpsO
LTTRAESFDAAAHAAHGALLDELRATLLSSLAPLVHGAPRIALVDFPAHSNVGDSAIWLGALAAVRALGAPAPVYTCDASTYHRDTLARALGDDGLILFTGGGSFGDLWERHLKLRERVVTDFPRHRIVQLPESVHFTRAESLARARATFDGHERVTILAREEASLAFLQREFRTPVQLAPDLAFALGALARPAQPSRDVLWLKRDDKEDRFAGQRPADAVDWIAEPRTPLIAWTDWLREGAERRPWQRPLARRLLPLAYPALARQRLARGLATLAGGKVLVTDRLHGHILSMQLGIPHVVLDNSYGKLHHFVSTWTQRSPFVRCAASPDEAAACARSLLEALRP